MHDLYLSVRLLSMHDDEVRNSNSRHVTINSSKLKWLSLLSYIAITLAVFDRDVERSGGDSIYGAIPKNSILFYVVPFFAAVQSAGYLYLGIININKISYLHHQQQSQVTYSGLHDYLKQRKYVGISYWGLVALSCFTAIINSIYLIFFLNSESVNSSYLNDANSFQSDINGSFLNDTFSKFNGKRDN